MYLEMLFCCTTNVVILMTCLPFLVYCATPDNHGPKYEMQENRSVPFVANVASDNNNYCRNDQNKVFVWCIPNNYNKHDEPFRHNTWQTSHFPGSTISN